MIGERPKSFQDELAAPAIVLAHDLTPSEAAGLDPGRVPGFATEAGGRASHTAIVAAALEIPAVVGLGRFLDRARHCRMAIIDGDQGLVILDPDEETQERYRTDRRRAIGPVPGPHPAGRPARRDAGRRRVELWGNIEFGGEVAACLERGAAGVGLFRTEFLFLNAQSPPSEDQQFEAYAAVVRSLRGRPIIDPDPRPGRRQAAGVPRRRRRRGQPGPGPAQPAALAPRPGLFRPQLRALLRASALGDVRILFPLVSTLAELRPARAVLDDVAAELRAEGHRDPREDCRSASWSRSPPPP